ncbi:putative ABC transport system permease protein [Kriegella aquimaris]|uniref:Putative ABC transport system permease protein n=2 Tax=Kriegella aquimaris TaxID=192904 RepID=A0A1G9SA09_9FLAO|nr:putative ABC transport system permease protein [Kriegella aquimaris]
MVTRLALRSYRKNKMFFFINIFGLTIGSAMLLIILNYTFYENSYDTFHTASKDIYRVNMDEFNSNEVLNEYAITYPAVGPTMLDEFPEVVSQVRMYTEATYGPVVFTYTEPDGDVVKSIEQRTYYADDTFFEIFDFKLKYGNPDLVLDEPNSAVISERIAEKFFKGENPINKNLRVYDRGGSKDLLITGVAENPPINSHIQFDVIISYPTLCADEWCTTSWDFTDFTTYIQLAGNTDPNTIESKIPSLVSKFKNHQQNANDVQIRFGLLPIEDIHLYSDRIQELTTNSDGNNVKYLLISAFLILVMSWVNYVSLSTALSAERVRGIGILKVLGSDKKQLIYQYIGESAILNLLALIISVIIAEVSLGMISNNLLDETLPSYLFDFSTSFGLLYKLSIVGIFVFNVISSGIYPAFFLSSIKLINAIQGRVGSIKESSFRNTLVTAQFSITFILCAFLFSVFAQINHMRSSDLGFHMEDMVIIQAPRVLQENQSYSESTETLKNELLNSPHITSMTASSLIPGKPHNWGGDIKRLNHELATDLPVQFNGVDYDFVKNYGLDIIAGRDFSKNAGSDSNGVVILNQSAIERLQFDSAEDAIGENILMFGGDKRKIIGVVSDYKQESLKKEPAPYVLFLYDAQGYYSLRVSNESKKAALAHMSKVWGEVFPNNPINYFFLEDNYNEQYKGEYHFFVVFSVSAGLLLLIACIGLFGLLAFATNRSIKEISIRKVFGASIMSIWLSLYKSLFILLGIAILVALPVSSYIINLWLEGYASRISIGPLFFLLPFLMVVSVLICVIVIYSEKISRVNPAVTLKNE